MKNKKIIAIGCVALVITLVVGMGIGISIGNKNNNPITNSTTVDGTQPVEELPTIREDGVSLVMTQENFDEIVEKVNSYEEIYIRKTVYQYTDLNCQDGEIQRQNIECYETGYSETNGFGKTYNVNKIEEALAEFNCDVDALNLEDYEVNPEDILRIDTSKKYKNNMEILLALTDAYGLSTDKFVGSRLDEEMYDNSYEEYKQKAYYFPMKNDFDLSLMGLNEEDYDKINSIEIKYHTSIVSDGREMLDGPFIVIVQFTKDGIENMRILDLEIIGILNEE